MGNKWGSDSRVAIEGGEQVVNEMLSVGKQVEVGIRLSLENLIPTCSPPVSLLTASHSPLVPHVRLSLENRIPTCSPPVSLLTASRSPLVPHVRLSLENLIPTCSPPVSLLAASRSPLVPHVRLSLENRIPTCSPPVSLLTVSRSPLVPHVRLSLGICIVKYKKLTLCTLQFGYFFQLSRNDTNVFSLVLNRLLFVRSSLVKSSQNMENL